MTGSEKADGYLRDAFDGLAESERETVFRLLESELLFSVEWLFYLDSKLASEVVAKAEREYRGDGYRHVFLLQESMIRHTGQMQYQEHLLGNYSNYVGRLKPLIINAVGRTPAMRKRSIFSRDCCRVKRTLVQSSERHESF